MTAVDLSPGSPEWCRRVSPSKVAGILGLSPWESPYAMWRKMRGDVPWDEENEAMERGNLCEPAVLAWWRKHNDYTAWEEQPTFTLEDWCVATPDALTAMRAREPVLVEAKTAANMDDWGEPGTDQIPLHYLAQVYAAMEVCHRNGVPVVRAEVPVLGGYRMLFYRYVVEYNAEHGANVLELCRAFYDTLDAGNPPPLDDTVATWEAVRAVHPDIDRDTEAELTYEQAEALVNLTAMAKDTETSLRGARSAALEAQGRAQYATHNGVRVARRQPRGDTVSFVVTAKPEDLPTTQETP